MEQSKKQILRYLGHRGQEIPPQLDALIEECMRLIHDTIIQNPPRHIYITYDLVFPIKGKNGGETKEEAGEETEAIPIKNTRLLLSGTDIRRHLSGCHQIVLLAATLGVAVDNLVRRWQTIDLTRSLVLDACATELIEHCCDKIETQIRQEAQAKNLSITPRFSPGYGDLPLDLQPTLLATLDAEKKIGLTCTQSRILLPRKSVTAFIGVRNALASGTINHAKPVGHINNSTGCEGCSLTTRCPYQSTDIRHV